MNKVITKKNLLPILITVIAVLLLAFVFYVSLTIWAFKTQSDCGTTFDASKLAEVDGYCILKANYTESGLSIFKTEDPNQHLVVIDYAIDGDNVIVISTALDNATQQYKHVYYVFDAQQDRARTYDSIEDMLQSEGDIVKELLKNKGFEIE